MKDKYISYFTFSNLGYFINGDRRKLMVKYICHIFYTFRDTFVSELYIQEQK